MDALNSSKKDISEVMLMLIISIACLKGGVSKSTTTICLAVCASMAGYRVAIIDLDKQESAFSWSCRRGGKKPLVYKCSHDELDSTLARLSSEHYELVFIDTAGALGATERKALSVCDLALVPCAPSRLDLEAALPTARAIHALGKPFFFVLTRCPLGERRISQAQAILDKLGGRAGDPLHFRVEYQDAIAAGLGVTEHKRSGPAALEILSLWRWTAAQLGLAEGKVIDGEA